MAPSVLGTWDTAQLPRRGDPVVVVRILSDYRANRHNNTFSLWNTQEGEWLRSSNGTRRAWSTQHYAQVEANKHNTPARTP